MEDGRWKMEVEMWKLIPPSELNAFIFGPPEGGAGCHHTRWQ
jgi:hypothetical protein